MCVAVGTAEGDLVGSDERRVGGLGWVVGVIEGPAVTICRGAEVVGVAVIVGFGV